MKVKILGKEAYGKKFIYLRKLVCFRKEQTGDRIRILSYFFDAGTGEYKKKYTGLDNIECNILYNTMNNSILEA